MVIKQEAARLHIPETQLVTNQSDLPISQKIFHGRPALAAFGANLKHSANILSDKTRASGLFTEEFVKQTGLDLKT